MAELQKCLDGAYERAEGKTYTFEEVVETFGQRVARDLEIAFDDEIVTKVRTFLTNPDRTIVEKFNMTPKVWRRLQEMIRNGEAELIDYYGDLYYIIYNYNDKQNADS